MVIARVADPHCREITTADVDAGIEVAQHYAMEALRLFDAGAANPEILDAEQLLAWLHTRPEDLISLPDAYQRGPNAIRDKASALRAITILGDHGHLERVEGGCLVNGVMRQDVWRLLGRSR